MFEFVSFEPSIGQSHLGIASVRAWGKVTFRYKIVPFSDKPGWFPQIFSCRKSTDEATQEHAYEWAFEIDSRHEDRQIKELIKLHVDQILAGTSFSPIPATFPHQAKSIQPSAPFVQSSPNMQIQQRPAYDQAAGHSSSPLSAAGEYLDSNGRWQKIPQNQAN